MQGNLGEHNWAEGAFTLDDLSEDAILRAYSATKKVDWFSSDLTLIRGSYLQQTFSSSTASYDLYGGHSSAHVVSVAFEWEKIADMEITLTSGNSLFWITFTGQVDFRSSADIGVTYGTGNNLSGIQIGIFIDGNLISETVTGSMDRSNDHKGEGHHFRRDPFTIDAVVPVSPGSHQITARVRMARHQDYDKQYDSTTDFYAIMSRQLYMVEMR